MSDDFKYQKVESLLFYGEVSNFAYKNIEDCDCEKDQCFISQFDYKPHFIENDNAWITVYDIQKKYQKNIDIYNSKYKFGFITNNISVYC